MRMKTVFQRLKKTRKWMIGRGKRNFGSKDSSMNKRWSLFEIFQ
jgi:hypothetical protein